MDSRGKMLRDSGFVSHPFFFFFFCFLEPHLRHYGRSQTRDLIGAAAAGHGHSHSNTISEPHLRPTPQLMAMPDP